jgi:hypothetical protein
VKLSELIERLQQFETRFKGAFGVDVETDVTNLRISANIIMSEELPDPFEEHASAVAQNLRDDMGRLLPGTGERFNNWKVTVAKIHLDRAPVKVPAPRRYDYVEEQEYDGA